MGKEKIQYPNEINEYIELLDGKVEYSRHAIESALRNCFKQVVKLGFSSINEFHDYLQTFSPNNNPEYKDFGKYLDLELSVSRKNNPAVFNKLMMILNEKKLV